MSTNNHNQGWVKLHRSLRDSPIIKDPRLLQVLIDCLLKANHKKGGYITPAGWIDIEPGQFMVGVFKQTAHLGIRKATWYKKLKKLEAIGVIELRKISYACTVGTFVNWDSSENMLVYQGNEAFNECLSTTGTEKSPQGDTNKNEKNKGEYNKGQVPDDPTGSSPIPTSKFEQPKTSSLPLFQDEEKEEATARVKEGVLSPIPRSPFLKEDQRKNNSAKEFILWFAGEFKRIKGRPYLITWGKEVAQVSRLLKQGLSIDQLKEKAAFAFQDDWFLKNAGIGLFASQINHWESKTRKENPTVSNAQKIDYNEFFELAREHCKDFAECKDKKYPGSCYRCENQEIRKIYDRNKRIEDKKSLIVRQGFCCGVKGDDPSIMYFNLSSKRGNFGEKWSEREFELAAFHTAYQTICKQCEKHSRWGETQMKYCEKIQISDLILKEKEKYRVEEENFARIMEANKPFIQDKESRQDGPEDFTFIDLNKTDNEQLYESMVCCLRDILGLEISDDQCRDIQDELLKRGYHRASFDNRFDELDELDIFEIQTIEDFMAQFPKVEQTEMANSIEF